MKYCNRCNEWKEENEFVTNNCTKDGLSTHCKVCEKIRIKKWKKDNPEKVKEQRERYKEKNKLNRQKCRQNYRDNNKDVIKDYALRKSYGINLKEYMDMFLLQNGCCAICYKPQQDGEVLLAVDHDHKNNKVRGLLCRNCNIGLGMFEDNTGLLKSAIKYLEDKNAR